MLWNNSQETWRDFLTRCYKASAGQLRYTMEAAADEVVKLHNTEGAQAKTGQHFNPASVTEANRLKANCAALQRFMEKDDVIEMLPYILGSMSPEAKLAFASQYLRPAGLTVHLADTEAQDGLSIESSCETQLAAAQAMSAITTAVMNPTEQNLDIAEREAAKATEKFKRIRAFIGGARAKFKGAMGKLRKVPA